MNDAPAPDDHVRKTVSFTHKQLSYFGGTMAALALVHQLNGMFVPHEKGVALDGEIKDIKESVVSLHDDLTHKIERSTDKIIEQLNKSEARNASDNEKIEARVNILETMQFDHGNYVKPPPKKKTND